MFCPSLLASVGLDETLDCTNLSVTDKVLDAFKQKCVVHDIFFKITTCPDYFSVSNYTLPPQHTDSWMDCTTAVVEPMLLIRGDGHISLDRRVNPGYSYHTIRTVDHALRGIPGVTVIRTTFDRDHPDNCKFPAETDQKENIYWTEQE